MIVQRAGWRAYNPFGALNSFAEVRGIVLSHLIGVCFMVPFVFERIVPGEIYYTKFVDIPIRLLAVWLIIDRVGRLGRNQVSAGHTLQLGFAGLYGMALVYADIYMQRDSGLQNYISWISNNFNPYFFFLIAREGTLRRGFRPNVVIRWMLGTLLFACFVALIQALDIGGLRENVNDLVHQRQAEARMEGPSQPWQARGLFVHANNMAIMLIMGFALLASAGNYRRFGVFEWICGVTFLATLFATYSRTGIVSVIVMGLGLIAVLFVQRRTWPAFIALFTLGSLLFVFVASVIVFDIKRYEVFVKGEGTVKKATERGLYGVYARQENLKKAIDLAVKFPFTGVKIATSALNQQNVIQRSTYTFEGLILNVYGFAFVSYGLIGLAYLAGVLYALTIPQLKLLRTKYAFSSGAALCGLAIAITGISENTLFTIGHMTIVNIIMAFAVQKVARPDKPKELDPMHPGALAGVAQS